MKTQPTPALSPQTLGAYIGVTVSIQSPTRPSDRFCVLYAVSRGSVHVLLEATVWKLEHHEIRLQLRRVESVTQEEMIQIFATTKAYTAEWEPEARRGLWEYGIENFKTTTPYLDWLRARGFDCGGFDAAGVWHPSLIEAGLADEVKGTEP